MALDRIRHELRRAMDTRTAAEHRAAAEWRDAARDRIERRYLVPVHVEDRALTEALQRASERIDRLLREL